MPIEENHNNALRLRLLKNEINCMSNIHNMIHKIFNQPSSKLFLIIANSDEFNSFREYIPQCRYVDSLGYNNDNINAIQRTRAKLAKNTQKIITSTYEVLKKELGQINRLVGKVKLISCNHCNQHLYPRDLQADIRHLFMRKANLNNLLMEITRLHAEITHIYHTHESCTKQDQSINTNRFLTGISLSDLVKVTSTNLNDIESRLSELSDSYHSASHGSICNFIHGVIRTLKAIPSEEYIPGEKSSEAEQEQISERVSDLSYVEFVALKSKYNAVFFENQRQQQVEKKMQILTVTTTASANTLKSSTG